MTQNAMNKQSCGKCRWLPVCIDPCDDCENMNVLDDAGNLLSGKEYCNLEQGDKECRKITGPTCKDYEPKLSGFDPLIADYIEKLS